MSKQCKVTACYTEIVDDRGYCVEHKNYGIVARDTSLTKALAKQVGGEHYKKNIIQPWHIIDNYKLDFYLGNALKYILRDKGNQKEDLGKAIHYLERKLELLEENPNQGHFDLCEGMHGDNIKAEDIN